MADLPLLPVRSRPRCLTAPAGRRNCWVWNRRLCAGAWTSSASGTVAGIRGRT